MLNKILKNTQKKFDSVRDSIIVREILDFTLLWGAQLISSFLLTHPLSSGSRTKYAFNLLNVLLKLKLKMLKQ